MKEQFLNEARQMASETIALRRKIHAHPELGLDLPVTKKAVMDAIGDLDMDFVFSKETTGIVANLKGAEEGPTILLRGDMDALPMPEDTGLEFASTIENRMHACGHDTHTAMLASAARLLHRHRDKLKGNVKFMFQPGEEGDGGADIMLKEGVLHAGGGFDAAFAMHIMPNAPLGMVGSRAGALLAAADTLQVTVHGRGGHGSMPHSALDPVPVACEIVQASQTYVTRQADVHDPIVLTFGVFHAGTASNIIPAKVEMEATLRSLSPEARSKAHAGLQKLIAAIAEAHGARADITLNIGYPPTINDGDFVKFVETTAKDLLGEEKWMPLKSPIMGAEDFSYVLQQAPGCMVFLGVGPDGEEAFACPACHSNHMHVNEDALSDGVALHASVAYEFLMQQSGG